MPIQMNMVAGEDKDLILIVRINLDTEYMYFSDTPEWDESELQVLHFDVLNLATRTGTMRIKHLYFHLQNLAVYFSPDIGIRRTRNPGGERGFPQTEYISLIKDYIKADQIFANVKGYM